MDPSRAGIAVTTCSEEGGARGMQEFLKLAERGSTPATEARSRVRPLMWVAAVAFLVVFVAS